MGQRLKNNFKAVLTSIKALQDAEIQNFLNIGYFEIENQRIELDEIRIIYCTTDKVNENLEIHSNNEVLVLIDMTQHEELLEEGLAREIINRIQKLKKKACLIPTDSVEVYYELFNEKEKDGYKDGNEVTIEQIQKVIVDFKSMIQLTIKSVFKPGPPTGTYVVIISETVPLKGVNMKLTICLSSDKSQETVNNLVNIPIVNLLLAKDINSRFGFRNEATLSLVHSVTKENISWDVFKYEIDVLFGLYGVTYDVYKYDILLEEAVLVTDLKSSLAGKLLVISRSKGSATDCFQSNEIIKKVKY